MAKDSGRISLIRAGFAGMMTVLLCAAGCIIEQSASSARDAAGIKLAFVRIQQAIREDNRKGTMDQLSSDSVAFFGDCRRLAMNLDSADLEAKPQIEVLMAFQARWSIGEGKLGSINIADMLGWAVKSGIVPLDPLAKGDLADIQIKTNRATAHIRTGGVVLTNAVLFFERHDGKWNLDLKAGLLASEPYFDELRLKRKLTKAETAVLMLEGMNKQPIPALRELLLPEELRQKISDLKDAGPARKYEAVISELSAGRQSDAESMLEVFVSLHTNDQCLAFAQATCARSRWSILEATMGFRSVLELNPTTAEGSCAKCILDLDRRRDVPENMNTLRMLTKQNPENPFLLWLMAIECREHFKLTRETTYSEDAAICYRRLLEMFKIGPVLVHQTFANVLTEELDHYEEALKHRRIAVELEPAGWTYQGLGNTLSLMDRFDEANQAFAKMIEHSPQDPDYYSSWSGSLYEQRNYEECIGKCAKVIELDPSNYTVYFRWGSCLLELKKDEEALDKFVACTKIKPDHDRAHCLAGVALRRLGKTSEAITFYKSAADLGNTEALVDLGEMYVEGLGTTNDYAAAVELCRKGVERGDQSSQYSLGLMYEHGRGVAQDSVQALKWYRRAALRGYGQANRRMRSLMASSGISMTTGSKKKSKVRAFTPLHAAAQSEKLDEVERLLAAGADVNAEDSSGATPLMLAACFNKDVEVVRALLDKGADVNATGLGGESALMLAASHRHIETVKLLLDRGADVNAKDQYGNTPLSMALFSGIEMLTLLVDKGADVNAKDMGGETPLNTAVRMEQEEVAEFLRQHGAKE